MGYFPVTYDSGVVNYDRRGFIRLATGVVLPLNVAVRKRKETKNGLNSIIFGSIRAIIFKSFQRNQSSEVGHLLDSRCTFLEWNRVNNYFVHAFIAFEFEPI